MGGITKVWISKEVIYYECAFCELNISSSLFGGYNTANLEKSDD